MAKFRFRTKEEIISIGFWDEKKNCPLAWNEEGKMDKYLGQDIPDEFNLDCGNKKIIMYDGWMFFPNNYILKA